MPRVKHNILTNTHRPAVSKLGLSPSEMPPPWSVNTSEETMKGLGTTTTIFSLTMPGVSFLEGEAARDMARRVNEYAANLRDQHPGKFGFLATLPSLFDSEGCIKEIRYALGELRAEGVLVFSSYGDGNTYLGNNAFRPVWKELNAWKAVVLLHPAMPRNTAGLPPTLVPNVVEFPHETTRSAMDLLFSNTKRDHPDCKIILSHAGGTLPYIVGRIGFMEVFSSAEGLRKTKAEIEAEIKSFYFDLALSGHDNALNCLLNFIPHDHILFGSDTPYAPLQGVLRMNDAWETYTGATQEVRDMVNFKSAYKILPMFQNKAT